MIPRPQLPHLHFVLLVLMGLVLLVAVWWRYMLFALVCMALLSAVKHAGKHWRDDDERGRS